MKTAETGVMASLPLLFAHRLGRDCGPDSSRAALKATLAGPVDGLETDVCMTADGQLALLHEPWLSGATTAQGWAHQTPWRELRTARLRDRDGGVTTETPMLLEELLDRVPPGLTVQIEVKAYGDPALARATATAVCRLVDARTDGGSVEVISFHSAACEEAAKSGIASRLVVWADYAPAALARWARRTGVGGVCVEHFLLHRELLERLRSAGLSVATGTINDPLLAARAADLGVDAITTDRPAALHHELTVMSLAA